MDVLKFMKQTGASYQNTAIQFNMNNPNLIVEWKSKLLKNRLEGLEQMNGLPSLFKMLPNFDLGTLFVYGMYK